ncbi:TetR/AcrR family transcriptional regulator [Rhodococcus sp. NPDC060086]|uniref:TetR/AcrR family transcriptional regulator n=1 Tax=unclassified Rhodococcus (in: high G+C Gram-positive bacteria) TaxID=192944 RepID=UPI00364A6EA2
MNTPIPIVGESVERGDAARNRQRLLDAAALLVAERGPDAVTMDAVAARAGVGKGTVFRRFGSRAGLMAALLDHSESAFQHACMYGPPPLGPDAEPIARLIAFGRARIELVEVQGELLRAAESSAETRHGNAPRQVSLIHLEILLRATGMGNHSRLLAHSLLASLDPGLILYQWHELGYPLKQLADNWADLAHRVVTGHSAPNTGYST